MDRLATYRAKRDFDRTPEPYDGGVASSHGLRFSVQKHAATRLHYDLRLEWNGVLLSWAVTRGPSLDPSDKRLAVRTEDHPLSYLEFEGVIPDGYGAGRVMLWDLGWWRPLGDMQDDLAAGRIKFRVLSHRLSGAWMLLRMKGKSAQDRKRENWLLIKEKDSAVDTKTDPTQFYQTSIATGRSLDDIGNGTPSKTRKRGKNPAFAKPQLATLREDVPEGTGWWYEPKHDGYRAIICLGKNGPRLFTRNGHDWTEKFGALSPYLAELPCASAVLDGEVVSGLGPETFSGLQQALKGGGPLVFYAFDLLHLDGVDLQSEPLRKRRAHLEALFDDVPQLAPLRLSPVVEADGRRVLKTLCEAGGEGIICKRADAPYRGRRTSGWVKVKCGARADFLIAGYVPSDKKGRPFASLIMASRDDGALVYRGRVGSGFDESTLEDLSERLRRMHSRHCVFSRRPADAPRDTVWVKPELVAEVSYTELTDSGRIRHGVFSQLKEARATEKVARRAKDPDARRIAGIHITSASRKVFPDVGITKGALAHYYEAVAKRMLATTAGRPLSLLRYPGGLSDHGFFQKHAGKGFPDAIGTTALQDEDETGEDFMHLQDVSGLIAAVQMGTIEFHIRGARRDRLERPDRMVFDLDPGPDVRFGQVRQAAFDIRDRLSDLGLDSHAMVTGGKGIHVIVGLRRTATWETVRAFSQTFAAIMSDHEPERFTASISKARREGRIFIDWLRNERSATAIAPFSVRARAGAPVAVPVSWQELAAVTSAHAFDLKTATEKAREPEVQSALASLGRPVVAKLQDWAGS